jgi:hypothetical protein
MKLAAADQARMDGFAKRFKVLRGRTQKNFKNLSRHGVPLKRYPRSGCDNLIPFAFTCNRLRAICLSP